MISAFLLLLAPALVTPTAAQAPVEPWCELEPVIARSTWIVTARIEKVRAVGQIGTHVELRVVETLHGGEGLRTFSYLADRSRLVTVGEEELLFLRPPLEDGYHYRPVGRVGARDSARDTKIVWLRKALEIRALARQKQPRAYLRWYEDSLQEGLRWEFWRALSELERLQRRRPGELRSMLSAARLQSALGRLEEGAAKKRLGALLRWRRRDFPAG